MKQKMILLADDDTDDTELFREALATIDPDIVCHCVVNGADALKKLEELDQLPGVIFLDVNMPIMNGWECLKQLKANPRYNEIPVIMISTSSHQKEMAIAMNLGALCYFVKPSNFNELTQVLQVITDNVDNGLKEAVLELQAGGSGHVFMCA